MALSSGRKGVKKGEVDYLGRIKSGGSAEIKEQIQDFYFRDNEGQAQYKTSESGEWVNFSKGAVAEIVYENDNPSAVVTTNIQMSKDMGAFDYLVIEHIYSTTVPETEYNILPVAVSLVNKPFICSNFNSSDTRLWGSRNCKFVNPSMLSVGQGYRATTTAISSVNDLVLITKIIGVKNLSL